MRQILIVLALMFAATGCGSTTTPGDDKYTQTWSKPYRSTSCDEWLNGMSPSQRFAAAADMLTGARNKGDGGSGVPSDDLIDEFETGLDNVCVEPTMTLSDAGAGLYLTDRSRFRP